MVIWSGKLPCERREQGVHQGSMPTVFVELWLAWSFKQSSSRLCEAIATMTKILCTQYIDPSTIEPLTESRLIPLNRRKGAVRPIGVGEVIRRIIGECVMNIAKKDVVEASGSLQLRAGQNSGSEATIHAMHAIFEADETDRVLLIDAFNALNRHAALHNIRFRYSVQSLLHMPLTRIDSQLVYSSLEGRRFYLLREQHRVAHSQWHCMP